MSKRARVDDAAAQRVLHVQEDVTDRLTPARRRVGRKTFSLPEDMIRSVEELAIAMDVSASDVVKFALREYLKRYEKV